MNTHPWIGLSASAGSIHGLVLAVGVDSVALAESDGHASTAPLHRLRLDNPAEARRRLEAAGAATLTANALTPDYKAIGRGIAEGFFDRIRTGLGYHSDASAVVWMACEAIGKGIGSARGGAF